MKYSYCARIPNFTELVLSEDSNETNTLKFSKHHHALHPDQQHYDTAFRSAIYWSEKNPSFRVSLTLFSSAFTKSR